MPHNPVSQSLLQRTDETAEYPQEIPKTRFSEGLALNGISLEVGTTWGLTGRADRIRTYGLLNPIQARYQTAPQPDRK